MKKINIILTILFIASHVFGQSSCLTNTLETPLFFETNAEECTITISVNPNLKLYPSTYYWLTSNGHESVASTITITLCDLVGPDPSIALLLTFNGDTNCMYNSIIPSRVACHTDCRNNSSKVSFISGSSSDGCTLFFKNTSFAAYDVSCDDCKNNTGIKSSKWELKDANKNGTLLNSRNVRTFTSTDFSFEPSSYNHDYGYLLCLTIVDCADQKSTYCKYLEDIPDCNPVTSSKTKEEIQIENKTLVNELRHFNVFPNPTSSTINIKLTKEPNVENEQLITIYNSLGEMMDRVTLTTAKSTPVDVKTWSPGVYFVTLKDNEKIIQTEKVVVQ